MKMDRNRNLLQKNGNLLQKKIGNFFLLKKRQKKNHSVNFHLLPRDTLYQVGSA